MTPIIKHFTDTDLYKLTMAYAVGVLFPRAQAQYLFVDRDNTVYPKGFADAVNEQIEYLELLRFTPEDEAFMKEKCYYLPSTFYDTLRGVRFSKNWIQAYQDNEGHLHFKIGEEPEVWNHLIYLEVMILAIVAELYYIMSGQSGLFDYDEYYKKSYDKAIKMLSNGLTVSEFGTRRRFCFKAQDAVVKAFVNADHYLKSTLGDKYTGKFAGTSNVYLARKYNVTPIGTMAHEFISAIAGMYGPVEANYIAMEKWQRVFDGALGIYLYDTYGFDAFRDNASEHFMKVFSGVRVDSGDNIEQLNKIIDLYKHFNIDPKSKQIVFSNALNTDTAIELHKNVAGRMQDSYGIGTHLTNDIDGVKPMNIVMKLVKIRITENRQWQDTCKMSNDIGKVTGNTEVVNVFKYFLHMM